jgi:hypothetical protein
LAPSIRRLATFFPLLLEGGNPNIPIADADGLM